MQEGRIQRQLSQRLLRKGSIKCQCIFCLIVLMGFPNSWVQGISNSSGTEIIIQKRNKPNKIKIFISPRSQLSALSQSNFKCQTQRSNEGNQNLCRFLGKILQKNRNLSLQLKLDQKWVKFESWQFRHLNLLLSLLELLLYSIVEDRRMLSKSKTNRNSLLKSKQVSLQNLATLNNFLDGQQSQTQYINKQIKKEVELAKKNQAIVTKTIQKINTEAQSLARRYEEEKERSEKLEFLVKHIESQILSAKMEKANDLKQNIETDQLVGLTEVLSEREKELEKICEKSNSQAYQLTKKIDTIRSLRSQRTIFSALFDKLERQLCNLQHCYKVLVIENKMETQELQQRIQEFNQCQIKGNKELQRLQTRRNESKEKRIEPDTLNINKSQALSVKQSPKTTLNETPVLQQDRKKVPSHNKQQSREKQKSLKYDNLVQKLAREKRVKMVMNELGISSIKQLPQDIDQLNRNNEELLNQNEVFFSLIQKTQEKLLNLSKKKKVKKTFTNKKGQIESKMVSISNSQTQIRRSKLQLIEFRQICKILHNKISEDQGKEQQDYEFLNEEEQIVFYMSQLQKYMEKSYPQKGINCLEKSKKPKPHLKRLTSFLVANHNEKNNFSIYQEKDLLDIAKKDMQRMNRVELTNSVRLKSE